jgi:hypothetical protein
MSYRRRRSTPSASAASSSRRGAVVASGPAGGPAQKQSLNRCASRRSSGVWWPAVTRVRTAGAQAGRPAAGGGGGWEAGGWGAGFATIRRCSRRAPGTPPDDSGLRCLGAADLRPQRPALDAACTPGALRLACAEAGRVHSRPANREQHDAQPTRAPAPLGRMAAPSATPSSLFSGLSLSMFSRRTFAGAQGLAPPLSVGWPLLTDAWDCGSGAARAWTPGEEAKFGLGGVGLLAAGQGENKITQWCGNTEGPGRTGGLG